MFLNYSGTPDQLRTLSSDNLEGSDILKSEVLHAIAKAKNRNAAGPDGVPMKIYEAKRGNKR